jgi:tRNA A-37 threonylcarbamoyl transferase component Bud32
LKFTQDKNYIKKSHIRGHINPDIDPALKNIILKNPDLLFQYAYEHLKNSKRARLALIKLNGQKYLLKRYNIKSIFHKFRQLFRAPLSRKIWQRNHIFSNKGMLTSNLLAAIDSGAGFSYQASFAVYAYIKGASESICTLKKYYFNEQHRKKLLSHLTRLIWQMHSRGIYHGDAKITNFIWVETCGKPRIWIIDLDGVSFKKKITNMNRLSDIKNLASSLTWWDPNIKINEELLDAYIRLHPAWGKKRSFWLAKLKKMASKQLKHRKKRRGEYSGAVVYPIS